MRTTLLTTLTLSLLFACESQVATEKDEKAETKTDADTKKADAKKVDAKKVDAKKADAKADEKKADTKTGSDAKADEKAK